MSQGNEHYRCGEYRHALQYYDRAVSKDPENAKILCNRAAAYMMLNLYAEVIADCKKV